jgi:phosphatidylethanolamine/phosphatidyl-N-methylethanolamine N-methyltransferase
MAKDIALFLGEMMRRPAQVVAIAPSSSATAQLITDGVQDVHGPIVEVGPGTGSFTKVILDRGVAPERLTLLEMNPRFCEVLREKFPGVTVLNRPAQDIEKIGLSNVGAVVSGIAILSRPQLQREIVGRALNVMGPNAFFTQFTYATSAPISKEMQQELGIRARKRGTIWANLPPARVYEFRRAHQ